MRKQDYVDAHGAWVTQLIYEGYDPYFLSFMFRQLPGSRGTVQETMMAEVERVYRTSLTRVIRNISVGSPRERWPIWMISFDYPVSKSFKHSLREVTINDGLHVHATVLIPPRNRLKVRFDLHLKELSHNYIRDPLIRIDAEPITYSHKEMAKYGMKAIKRGWVEPESLVYLPRSLREMPSEADRRSDGLPGNVGGDV